MTMVRVRARPSRLPILISMPTLRRKGDAWRSLPPSRVASAGQVLALMALSPATLPSSSSRSVAVPDHSFRSAMKVRTAVATRLALRTVSTASSMLSS